MEVNGISCFIRLFFFVFFSFHGVCLINCVSQAQVKVLLLMSDGSVCGSYRVQSCVRFGTAQFETQTQAYCHNTTPMSCLDSLSGK